ncbi:MAG TPA: ATP synthase subunit I [Lachnospiraceae bacterium]|nr:ATP synthase subunit I [Lachnospiraceae bacterium]
MEDKVKPKNDLENLKMKEINNEEISNEEIGNEKNNQMKFRSTVGEMVLAMIVFGFLCELIGIWFVQKKLTYSIGLWIGIALAIGMALHMAWALERAMDLSGKQAVAKIRSSSLIRYSVVVILYAIVAGTKMGNPLATFLGIMSLKVSAYLQPLTHKFCLFIQGNK